MVLYNNNEMFVIAAGGGKIDFPFESQFTPTTTTSRENFRSKLLFTLCFFHFNHFFSQWRESSPGLSVYHVMGKHTLGGIMCCITWVII
jgi:hypothetical protein